MSTPTEYVCTRYNDGFIAYLKSAAFNGGNAENISFDAQNNPVSVNNGFFDRCTSNSTTGCVDPAQVPCSSAWAANHSSSGCLAGETVSDPVAKTSACAGGTSELEGTGFRVLKDDDKIAPGHFHFERNQDRAHDHVIFHMSSGAAIIFNDPRRFGYMKVIARNAIEDEPLLKGLGPEPLGNEFDAAMLARSCANKKTSLKAALLDQRVVAGLGNIYVCEALFRAHLSPRRLAATLATKKTGEPTEHAKRLVTAIHDVLNQAIRAGGSSLRDHRQTNGELGYFQHSFQVYDREGEKCPTPGCGGTIKRFTQNGRSTFWCPKCQK